MYSEDKPKINQYVFEDANLYLKHLKLKKENYEFVPSFSETDEAVCNFLSAEYSKLPDNIAPDCYAWLRVQRLEKLLSIRKSNHIRLTLWLRISCGCFIRTKHVNGLNLITELICRE